MRRYGELAGLTGRFLWAFPARQLVPESCRFPHFPKQHHCAMLRVPTARKAALDMRHSARCCGSLLLSKQACTLVC